MKKVREELHRAGSVVDDLQRFTRRLPDDPLEIERKLRRFVDDLQRALRNADDEAKKLDR